jgi:hypothetical protein
MRLQATVITLLALLYSFFENHDPRAEFSCKGKWCDELVIKRKK